MDTHNLEDQIDLFVRGKLHGQDLASFEQIMASDPSIQMEVSLQKSIRSAIISQRKAALKARLDQIDVSALSTATSATTSGVVSLKVASVALVSAGLGVAAYLYVGAPAITLQTKDQTTQSTPNTLNSDASVSSAEEVDDEPNLASARDNTLRESSNEPVAETKISGLAEKKSVAERKASKTQKISKVIPNLDAVDDKSDLKISNDEPVSAPGGLASTSNIHRLSDVDIKTIQDGSHKFHYRLKDNVLYLYGDFNKSPYEILEFNGATGNVLYFYYDNNYYPMESGHDNISKLKKITDKQLISDLDQARLR